MNKKLPRVVALPITKKISHNKEVFYSFEKENNNPFTEEKKDLPRVKDIDDILDSINEVFKSTHHSFHVPVEIKTKDKTYQTRLAGKFGNKILTMDDDEIAITDIIDFKIKQ